MVSPTPGSTLASTSVTFTWTTGTGVTAYWLEVGTTPGGRQVSAGSSLSTTTTMVNGLPSNGSNVYVRLWSRIGGAWSFNDYSYVATGVAPVTTKAEMTTPAPGTKLGSTSVTFTWTTGTGVSAYWLELGTTPGGTQISKGSSLSTTSTTVSGLPSNGGTIHARLWSLIGGVWQYNAYTYTATGP
jgi:hypothetical protein